MLARPLLAITASVAVFALTASRLGLALSSFAAILIASLATREVKPVESVVFALALSTAAVLLFVKVLGLARADLAALKVRMELFDNLQIGLATALLPHNLLFCLIGVVIGTAIGVLPGIGPIPAVALLLPFTFGLSPPSAMIMLAGIFYGAQYGGSTTAILVNVPGETSSVVTCLDGHEMAKQGKAGTALAIAAISSFFAGTVATVVIAVLSVPLAALALKFTAVEYFSLLVLGLIAAVVLAHGSVAKSLAMVLLGILLGLVGIDVSSGAARMTFGIAEISDGLDFVPVAMGMFGLAEIIANLERPAVMRVVSQSIRSLIPSRADLRAAFPAMVRGTMLGSVLGVLPGGGAALPPFSSYALEKKLARDPSRFGKGAIEGVAGPEAANNAGAQTSFIPLLTLGIPANALMALMIGALMMQGIQPGPQIMREQPELVWGVIASMWVGNLMLLVINLPLDRRLGLDAENSLPAAVPGDRAVLLHRHLRHRQQSVQCLADARLRADRLLLHQGRRRAGAAAARPRARSAAGRIFSARDAARGRRLHGFPPPSDQRHAARHRRDAVSADGVPVNPAQPQGSACGVSAAFGKASWRY